MEALTRYWWVVALRGAAAVIFGVLALVWPDITVFALVILFGAYALVDGAFALGSAVFDRRAVGRRGWLIVGGIVGILIGIVTFLWPGATTLVLLWGEWIYILSGALSVLFGILLVALGLRLRRMGREGAASGTARPALA